MVIPAKPRRAPAAQQTTVVTHGGHRLKLKHAAILGVFNWASKRRGTRITPILMVATYPLALVIVGALHAWNKITGQWGAAPAAIDWRVVAVCGLCATWLMWLTQRQVVNKAVDNDISEQQSAQWAWRSCLVPAVGALFIEWIIWRDRTGRDILTAGIVLCYIVGCTALWTFLFTSGYVGGRRLADQLKRTWALRTGGTVLEGSRILARRRTKHGEEMTLDVSDLGVPPSQLMSGTAKESIAVKHKVGVERVSIQKVKGDASKVKVSITHTNPWEKEIPHPLFPHFVKGEPGARSIQDPIVLGADPTEHDERKRWITKTLYTNDGAQHLLVVAGTGAGKTNIVNNVVEHVTDCRDADIEMIDVTKGIDAATWRWAVTNIAVGDEALEAAVVILERAANLIKTRSAARRTALQRTAVFKPTKEDRALWIILDEADQVLVEAPKQIKARAQAAVKYILSKGRSEGVGIIVMAQRGTLDYLGKGDVKANSFTRIILGVSQTSEMLWAAGMGWEARGIPDLSNFGEGARGVFVLMEPQSFRTGRGCALYDNDIVSAIAMDRCRPEHLDDLIVHLHDMAEEGLEVSLLAGGRWDSILRATGLPPLPEYRPEQGASNGLAKVSLNGSTAPAWGSPGSRPDDPTDAEPARARRVYPGEEDPSRRQPDVDEAITRMRIQAGRAIAATRHAADQAVERGPVSMKDLIAAKQAQVSGVTVPAEVPAEVRGHIHAMAEYHGIRGFSRAELEESLAQVVQRMPSSRWVQIWLRILIDEGVLEMTGKGRYQRYKFPRRGAA